MTRLSNRPLRADAKRNHDALLAAARELMASGGADASLREIARKAGVGLGTLYRRFPTREALLEVLLRSNFDELAGRAAQHEEARDSGAALAAWIHDVVGIAHRYSGALRTMAAAIDDETSALHASCVTMKAAGARLLTKAQAEGNARNDIDGVDLFALIGAAAWVADQPTLASRRDHLTEIIITGTRLQR